MRLHRGGSILDRSRWGGAREGGSQKSKAKRQRSKGKSGRRKRRRRWSVGEERPDAIASGRACVDPICVDLRNLRMMLAARCAPLRGRGEGRGARGREGKRQTWNPTAGRHPARCPPTSGLCPHLCPSVFICGSTLLSCLLPHPRSSAFICGSTLFSSAVLCRPSSVVRFSRWRERLGERWRAGSGRCPIGVHPPWRLLRRTGPR